MKILETIHEAREVSRVLRREGTLGFVPTMGALHEGHLRLIRAARTVAGRCVVSIFVNPLQFGPGEDLSRYPRAIDADLALLENEAVDAVWLPSPEELYPSDFQTRVTPGPLARYLCGTFRNGHFEGVATICTKLFTTITPDIAVFGEKDFQQLRVLEQLVHDLNLGVRILRHPTVREHDGLALSSRNRYLTEAERIEARAIPQSLQCARELAARNSAATVHHIVEATMAILRPTSFNIQYIHVAGERTLEPSLPDVSLYQIEQPRLFVAGYLGTTRLIDNQALTAEDDR